MQPNPSPLPESSATGFMPWKDDILRPLYEQLKAIARARLRGGGSATLSPTVLVNEAILRLMQSGPDGADVTRFRDEAHFIATAATAMRHVAVDHARRKGSAKRRANTVQFDDTTGTSASESSFSPEMVIDIDAHLMRLSSEDAQLSTIVELRVFAGLTFVEIGALLDIAPKTAERRWHYAAAILRHRIGR